MKKIIILDVICYMIIPFCIWNYSRETLGDYYAMLLSTVPGLVYTIYRFILERQFNIAGLFILLSLCLSTIVNLLSESAERMLWNQIYLGYGYATFFLLSILFRKPLALYLAVDFVALQGYERENSKALFSVKGIFIWYQLLTVLFFVRGIFQNSLKAWFIYSYGVDGYGHLLIYMQISGWFFSGLIIAGFFFVGSRVNRYLKSQDNRHQHIDSQMENEELTN